MPNYPTETPNKETFYQRESLWKWFAGLSIIMFVFTIWMVLDDFGREWKGYQKEFLNIKEKRVQSLLEEAKQNVDEEALKEQQEALTAANEDLKSKHSEVDRLKNELISLKTAEKNKTVLYQTAKAKWDVDRYLYEDQFGHKYAAGHIEGMEDKAVKARNVLEAKWNEVLKLRNTANLAAQASLDKQAEIKDMEKARDEAKSSIAKIEVEITRLEGAKEEAQLTLHKIFRSSPIIDLANPVFKIQQIVLPWIRDDIFFAKVGKVDRCTTCHQAIDSPGFEDQPNPFKTHPKLDLMLGSRSPHPIDKIGCTVCHDGRGQAVDFTRAAHTPQNAEQAKLWKEKYHWHFEEHITEKMIPLQYTEGKCQVCHKQTEYVPRGQKVNESIQLVRSAGCYGCHRIEGWDHLRKPAPSLKRIKGKVTKDWLIKWIRNPHAFNEKSRMPRVFHLSNNQTPEFEKFQEAEIFALADFIYDRSEDYSPNVHLSLGSVEKGKELFGEVGCLGCHQIDDFPVEGRSKFGMAPDLSTVGSKVSKDWLVSWLKNPKHYWEGTTMPSLRLTDTEASNVAAYLMSKRNEQFETAQAGVADPQVQKTVLTQYLLRDPKLAPNTLTKVETLLSTLNPHETSLKLGEKTLQRYGCFGCHEISGYETASGIGTELTEEGSKPVKMLDYGLMNTAKTRYAWFDQKLDQPRIFDTGRAVEYLDTLRMPLYGFNEEERNRLILFLLGKTNEKFGPEAQKILNAHEAKAEAGLRVIHKYNCQGCHTVEMLYQPLPDGHPNFEEHEAKRYEVEARILAHYPDDITQGPPNIYGEGAKIRSDWVYKFIENPFPLRVSLKVRMPTYQMPHDELNALVEGWANEGKVEFPILQPQKSNLSGERLAVAQKMFNQLMCANCHTVGQKLDPSQLEGGSRGYAPDLALANKRLHRDWIVNWLKDPQQMQPGTRMPGFWPGGQSPLPDLLGGNSQAQMELIADYLIYLGEKKE